MHQELADTSAYVGADGSRWQHF